jgi:hypothetical protein
MKKGWGLNTVLLPGLLAGLLAALALLAPGGGAARADVLPPDSRFVERCARIENADEFPGVVLAAVVNRVDRTRTVSAVAPDQCLTKFYKFNRFRVYAVPRELAEKGLDSLDFGHDPRLRPLAPDIDPSGFFVPRQNPLTSVEEGYRVLGFSRDAAVACKAWETRRFEGGRPEETTRFPAPSAEGLSPGLEPR